MSQITAIASIGGGNGVGPGRGNALTPPPSRKTGEPASASSRPVGAGEGRTGGTSAAEATRTAQRIPVVTGARAANAASPARPGAEGRPLPEEDSAAERDRDLAERRLARQELLSRIPVPAEAIPKLGGDVETLRTIERREAKAHRDGTA